MLQRFIDDVGVLVAMVVITFIALVVVIIKVILVHNEVKRFKLLPELDKLYHVFLRLTTQWPHSHQWNK